jgi:hypothetical protein
VAAPVTLRPTFRDQQVCISSRQIEGLSNGVSRQVDAVNNFSELSRESHPHIYRQSSATGVPIFARNAEVPHFSRACAMLMSPSSLFAKVRR